MPLISVPTTVLVALREAGLRDDEIVNKGEVQPLVYLLQRAGAPFGYHYRWADVAPLSPDLDDELGDLVASDLPSSEPPLSGSLREAAAKARALIDPPPTLGMSRIVWLHLLATVDFLATRSHSGLERESRPAFVQRNFEDEHVDAAKQRLDEVLDDHGAS